jgi:glycosyltransferase involved in cell wall biosynthesis
VRILCITDEFPWPATTGYRIRVREAIRGLALAGDVDLFCTVSERDDLRTSASLSAEAAARLFVHHRPPFGPGARGMLRWLTSRWPRAVAWREWDEAAAALAAFARPPYDLVWYSACGTWLGLGERGETPVVVDFNDLEDGKLRTMRRLAKLQERDPATRHSVGRRLRRELGALLDAVDEGRWRRSQLRAADAVDTVVLCSELDRSRLGHPAGVVVPNSYELPEHAVTGTAPHEPVFTIVGLLTYPPNADAAGYFARAILPLVRERLPGARVKLVGRYDTETASLREEPGVELLGHVDDLDAVFASTAAVVVPLRAGGGTRIKILEAFARRVPVVSTTLGCEGLGVRHGEELLVADDPREFADACVRIYEDAALAASLVERGHTLWSSRYRAADIREQVRKLVLELGGR